MIQEYQYNKLLAPMAGALLACKSYNAFSATQKVTGGHTTIRLIGYILFFLMHKVFVSLLFTPTVN